MSAEVVAIKPPWQPMLSAPRDGNDVLLFWYYYYPGDRAPTCGYKIAAWDDENKAWDSDEGLSLEANYYAWMRPEYPAIPPRQQRGSGFEHPGDNV